MVNSVHSSALGGTNVNTQNTINSSFNYEAVLDKFLGIFLDRMFSGYILNSQQGAISNPLALTGGAIMILPFLTSMMNGAHATQRAQERVLPPKPQPTLVDSLNTAESNLSKAQLRLDTTKLDTRRQIDEAAQKLGLNVSDNQEGPKKPSKDSARLNSLLKETDKKLKESPDDLRLKIKYQILQNAINNGLSYKEAQAQIFEISTKFDKLDTSLHEANIAVQTTNPNGFSRLFSWFKKAPAQADPSKARLQESLRSLETSLNELGIYDLNQILSEPLSSAKKSV
jgi:hypothetical protein